MPEWSNGHTRLRQGGTCTATAVSFWKLTSHGSLAGVSVTTTGFHNFTIATGGFGGMCSSIVTTHQGFPWTTTKTDINQESAVYQRALQAMRVAGRPVAQFLYDLSMEVERPPEDEGTELAAIVAQATSEPLPAHPSDARFVFTRPVARRVRSASTVSIQYKRPIVEVEEAKQLLGVDSAAEVGQRTFEYFMKRERCLSVMPASYAHVNYALRPSKHIERRKGFRSSSSA